MNLARKRLVLAALLLLAGSLGPARRAVGQVAADGKVQMSQDVFKNVQILRGIPVDEFMDTMGMFAASLGYDCASCHDPNISSDRSLFAVATPAVQKARQMIVMMNTINAANFGGAQRITCFTCHRGQISPAAIPSLALQYGELTEDPSAMVMSPDRGATAGSILQKYVEALGGAQRLAVLTSYVAKGSYTGFNTGGGQVQVEVFAKAPNQRTQVVQMPDGDAVKVFDGKNGWVAEGWRPIPLVPLTGGNLTGAALDSLLMFPAALQNAFSQWQVSTTLIDDRRVRVLQGSNPGQLPVNFYFDETGLLSRVVRWNKTVVGTIPTQLDYSDYRVVSGVKLPFKVAVTWTDGQNTFDFSEIRPNVAIEATRFAKPAPFRRKQ
jgi:outer membrane lipoprotein-sorting protein